MTIEQRAKKYNPYSLKGDLYETGKYYGYINGYKTGATDQKSIDDASSDRQEVIDKCFRLFKNCLVQRWGIAKDVAESEVTLLKQAME